MPYVHTAGVEYALIAHDHNGLERTDDPDGLMSQRVLEAIARDEVTDVFMMSHGWKGDLASAKGQYDAWVGAMASCQTDLQRAHQRSGFQPAIIGFHWPSLPWGDENLVEAGVSFAANELSFIDQQVQSYGSSIAETPAACQALRMILTAAMKDPSPNQLPAEVREAYVILNRESGLGGTGEGSAPGDDRESFDPDLQYQLAREESAISFGAPDIGGALLWPLRQLSFWKMKDRARRVGETGGHSLLRALLADKSGLRLHLMGHSFGSIVVSASVAGPRNGTGLPTPIRSLVLVQGALSLWSYCSDIPSRPGYAGYFRSVIERGAVSGPILTTRSKFDRAVGDWYPRGAGVARQVVFATSEAPEYPKYGGVGTFGLQGPGLALVELDLKDADSPYGFEPSRIHNLECSRVIRANGGTSDAHCDIAHPEVAHAVWAAALT